MHLLVIQRCPRKIFFFLTKTLLVTQTVKNLPVMWETWVLSGGWEDPLEKGMATHSSILAWWIPDRAWQVTVHGVTESDNWETNTQWIRAFL